MKLENQTILIVSNEPWGNTWYSKHNYAWELSKRNNKVFFINPPKPFSILNWFTKNISEETIKENLKVITYKNILPVRFEFFRKLNETRIFKLLLNYFNRNKLHDLIFWSFDPLRLTSPQYLHPKLAIFHSVDKYLFLKKAEYEAPKNADIVICVAEDIAANYKNLNKNVKVIPHAVPPDEFIPPREKSKRNLKGIYVGNIDKRMDYAFTRKIVDRFPEIEFHFIGNTLSNTDGYSTIFYENLPNVIYHGEKPFKELKQYISEADFCFVFKDKRENGNNISSHKMMQYFAQGKPIFCSTMTQYLDIKDLLYMEDDVDKMTKLIENFIETDESKDLIQKRIDYAQKHSFENTFKRIEEFL